MVLNLSGFAGQMSGVGPIHGLDPACGSGGSPWAQKFGRGGGQGEGALAVALGVINSSTASVMPNIQTCGEPHRLVNVAV